MRTPPRAWLSSFAAMSSRCYCLDEIVNSMSGVIWRWGLSCDLFLIPFYILGLVIGMETRGEEARKFHHLLLIPLYLNWCKVVIPGKTFCIPAAKIYWRTGSLMPWPWSWDHILKCYACFNVGSAHCKTWHGEEHKIRSPPDWSREGE